MTGSEFGDPIRELERNIRQASVIIRKRGRDILADFDITPPQFNALLVLSEASGLTMGELCDRLYLACSTATDLIDRMERNGLIERERDVNDRRVIRLKVTDKGFAVVDQVMAARCRYLACILKHVEDQEREQLSVSLKRLNELMTKEMEIVPAD